jgi:hypothetical protein
MDTEVPEEGAVWTNSQIPGENLQGIGAAPGKPDSGGASVPGPYPYGDRDTAEVRGVASGRIYQRKKRDNNSPELHGTAKKLQRTKFWACGYITCQRLDGKRRVSRNTSVNRKMRTNGWISWKCSKTGNSNSRL